MATTLFPSFVYSTLRAGNRGRNDATADGATTGGWGVTPLSTSRGTSAANAAGVTSPGGPTNGHEVVGEFVSPPLAAGVTISGTITFNVRMFESSMSANVGAQCIIERLDNVGAIISTVVNSEKGVEVGTSEAAQNWTATPTSTTFAKGDRIRLRILGNDGGGTMASGFTFTLVYSGPTSGASGDTFITFTETLTFASDPAGTQLYLTDTTSPVTVSSTNTKEAWTSPGSGLVAVTRAGATGWTTPLRWTVSAGGNFIEWYSKRLQAFTLAGMVHGNFWAYVNTGTPSQKHGLQCEIAVVQDDGTLVSVFGQSGLGGVSGSVLESTTLPPTIPLDCWIAGPDIAVSDGQRLRIRVFLDDAVSALDTSNCVFDYAGTSAGADGDAWIQLPQTVSEFVPASDSPEKPYIVSQAVMRGAFR